MTIDRLMEEARKFLEGPMNFVTAEDALRPDIAGMRIYDEPLFGAASADDPLFAELRRPEVVHPGEMLPCDWVPGAKSVVSFFLPFTERVVSSNAEGTASSRWRRSASGSKNSSRTRASPPPSRRPTRASRCSSPTRRTGPSATSPTSAASAPSASRRGSSPSAAWRGASAASSRTRSSRRRRGRARADAAEIQRPVRVLHQMRSLPVPLPREGDRQVARPRAREGSEALRRPRPSARRTARTSACASAAANARCASHARAAYRTLRKSKKIVTGGPRGRLYI